MSDNKSYFQYIADLMALPFGAGSLDFTDDNYKNRQTNIYNAYMLDRTQKMFVWEGLPDTIPQRLLEFLLQTCGNICITKVDDELYAMWGGLGGTPDPYYQPTIFTVANPALNFSKNLEIGKDCVWCRNDSMGLGLVPLNQFYGSLLTECGITFRTNLILSRMNNTISAEDDRTLKSAQKYLEDVEAGKLGVISDSQFFEGLNIHRATTKAENLTDIIEGWQYIKASWFNDLGLNANYNMKRERIQNAEAENDNDALLPLIDDMLDCRIKICEEVNAMYGTNIYVKLASAWEDVQEDTDGTEESEIENEPDNAEIENISGSVVSDLDEDANTNNGSEEQTEIETPSETMEETPQEVEVNVTVEVIDKTEENANENEVENSKIERSVEESDN